MGVMMKTSIIGFLTIFLAFFIFSSAYGQTELPEIHVSEKDVHVKGEQPESCGRCEVEKPSKGKETEGSGSKKERHLGSRLEHGDKPDSTKPKNTKSKKKQRKKSNSTSTSDTVNTETVSNQPLQVTLSQLEKSSRFWSELRSYLDIRGKRLTAQSELDSLQDKLLVDIRRNASSKHKYNKTIEDLLGNEPNWFTYTNPISYLVKSINSLEEGLDAAKVLSDYVSAPTDIQFGIINIEQKMTELKSLIEEEEKAKAVTIEIYKDYIDETHNSNN